MLYGCEDSLYLAHKDLRMTKIEQRGKKWQKRSPERQFVIMLSHLVVVLFS